MSNVYDGAYRLWNNSLKNSARMLAGYNDVEIRAFDPSQCNGSCANGKTVWLYPQSEAYKPQGAVTHELGHVAHWVASPWKATGAYNYPSWCLNCGTWQPRSEEWKDVAFTEAIADFIGATAFWAGSAVQPCSQDTDIGCGASSYNLEEGPNLSQCGDIAPAGPRWPFQKSRFLWDVFDSHGDANHSDIVTSSIGQMIDTLAAFPDGTGNNQRNEPWAPGLLTVDDLDGRETSDFAFHYYNLYSNIYVFEEAWQNCQP